MDRIPYAVEFNHNGEEIKATLFSNIYNGKERNKAIMFNYNGNNIHILLNEDEYYEYVATLHCKIIDKIGISEYKKYDKYLSEINNITRNYIVVNNKVYNYFSECVVESPKYYILRLKFSDGTYKDGTYNFMETKDHGNKTLLFKNLQSQAENYYKNNRIEPSIDQLNEEKTQEYQTMKNWINEIHETV